MPPNRAARLADNGGIWRPVARERLRRFPTGAALTFLQ